MDSGADPHCAFGAITSPQADGRQRQRAEFTAACLRHLASVGPKEWGKLLAQFPDVAPATAWRWIRTARNSTPSGPELRAAAQRLQHATAGLNNLRAQEAERRGICDLARSIPSAPAPATVCRDGSALLGLNFLADFDALFRDAHALRDSAVRQDNGGEHVINPRTFDRSISRRRELIEARIAVRNELWDLERMEVFYTTIINTVAEVAPEVARRIQARLADLNVRTGMTSAVDDGPE